MDQTNTLEAMVKVADAERLREFAEKQLQALEYCERELATKSRTLIEAEDKLTSIEGSVALLERESIDQQYQLKEIEDILREGEESEESEEGEEGEEEEEEEESPRADGGEAHRAVWRRARRLLRGAEQDFSVRPDPLHPDYRPSRELIDELPEDFSTDPGNEDEDGEEEYAEGEAGLTEDPTASVTRSHSAAS